MSENSPSSEVLFQLFQGGDKEAYALLFQKFLPGLVFVAALRLPDNPRAEEIATNSLFKAWKKRKSFRNLAEFSIFLDKETENVCNSHQDPPSPSRNPPKENRDPEFYPHDTDIDSPYVPLLEKVIGQMELSSVTRRIFDLHFIEGKTRSQIAVKMNMTREAVAARIRRALDPDGAQRDIGSLPL